MENYTKVGCRNGSFSEIICYYDLKNHIYFARKVVDFKINDETKLGKGNVDQKYKEFVAECSRVKAANCSSHPNIIKYYEPHYNKEEQKAWVDMEYIQGDTIQDYIEKNNYFVEIGEIYRLIQQISDALAFCHVDIYKYRIAPGVTKKDSTGNEHVVYEDVKPEDLDDDGNINPELTDDLIKKYRIIHNDLHSSNIIRQSGTGRFFLFDFGISLNIMEDKKNGEIKSSIWAGAPAFMAPEKLEESEKIKSEQSTDVITPETDIYSFGVILYQMLSGELPCKNTSIGAWEFRNGTPQEISAIRKRHFEESHPGETYVKDYPDWLEKLIMKCLEKNPQDRYHNAKELLEEFKNNYNENNERDASILKAEIRKKEQSIYELFDKWTFAEQENKKLLEKYSKRYVASKSLRVVFKILNSLFLIISLIQFTVLLYYIESVHIHPLIPLASFFLIGGAALWIFFGYISTFDYFKDGKIDSPSVTMLIPSAHIIIGLSIYILIFDKGGTPFCLNLLLSISILIWIAILLFIIHFLIQTAIKKS